MPRTFGRAQLNKQLEGGIELHEARQMLQQAKEAGVWNWRHATRDERMLSGSRAVPVSLQESRKPAILEMEMNVDEFLPAPVTEKKKEDLGLVIVKTLKGKGKCSWRQYTSGAALKCENSLHESSSTMCIYHLPHCVMCDEKIDTPNAFGLCDEHHLSKFHKLPAKMRLGIPGVTQENFERAAELSRIASAIGGDVEDGKDEHQGAGDTAPICDFHATNEHGWRYTCSNPCARQEQTGAFLRKCIWHTKICVRDNPWDPQCSAVGVPNQYGVCMNHYLSLTNGAVLRPRQPWDVPGAVNHHPFPPTPRLPDKHMLAPKHPPPVSDHRREDLNALYAVHDVPPSCMDRCFMGIAWYSSCQCYYQSTRYKMKHKSNDYATGLQKITRGFLARRRVRRIRLSAAHAERCVAVTSLQRFARGHFGRKYARAHREEFQKSWPVIQRVMRGALTRKKVRTLRAARVLQRAWRCFNARAELRGLKLKTVFIATLREHEEKEYERNLERLYRIYRRVCARRIISVIRGYVARKKERRRQMMALRIQNVVRGRRARRYVRWWRRTANANALTIQRIWRGKMSREDAKLLIAAMYIIVASLQRFARGFLGRKRAMEERARQELAWKWLDPSMPRHAFRRFLPRSTPFRRNIYLPTPDPFFYPEKEDEARKLVDGMSDVWELDEVRMVKKENEEVIKRMLMQQMLYHDQQHQSNLRTESSMLRSAVADIEAKEAAAAAKAEEDALLEVTHHTVLEECSEHPVFRFRSNAFTSGECRLVMQEDLEGSLERGFPSRPSTREEIQEQEYLDSRIAKQSVFVPPNVLERQYVNSRG
eukprot:g2367.t1